MLTRPAGHPAGAAWSAADHPSSSVQFAQFSQFQGSEQLQLATFGVKEYNFVMCAAQRGR